MSYHSIHMQHPITGGYRISQLERCTVAMLSRKTWQELRTPDPYLNGNTKWQEMPIVAFFIKNGFMLAKTNNDIGYASFYNCTTSNALRKRLDKVNTQSLLSFTNKLMISGLLKRSWAWLLDPDRRAKKITGKRGGGPIGIHRILFSKAIVRQAILRYGLNKVSMKLRVDMKVITFWHNYEI